MPLMTSTKLDAVNSMLFAIGESPVNTLEGGNAVDAVMAEQVLDTVSREVQSEGWPFNSDTCFPLTRPMLEPFYIYVPETALACDPTDKHSNIVVRGDKLYDRDNHSFIFPEPTTVECDIVWLLPFDELPETAKRYITIRAARIFQAGAVGSDKLDFFTDRDEQRAQIKFRKAVTRVRDKNLLTASTAIARILAR